MVALTQSIHQSCTAFDAVCQKVGRNPSEVEKVTSFTPSQLTGSTKEVVARLRAIADAGIRLLILELPSQYDWQFLQRCVKDILPEFH
jgi:hypothetical protein